MEEKSVIKFHIKIAYRHSHILLTNDRVYSLHYKNNPRHSQIFHQFHANRLQVENL